jgi:heat shock protein 4
VCLLSQKKKKLKKNDLVVVNKAAYQLPAATIDMFKNVEYEMMVQDRQIKELQERKNDLEGYIYGMRDRVNGGNLNDYISQADKDVFLPLLDQMENWLYDEEAESANKSAFVAKLDELKKFGEPAAERLREEEEREDAYKELSKALVDYGNLAATQDAAYDHIDAEARDKVKACVDEVSVWMADMQRAQAAKAKTEPVACLCKDIYSKKTHVIDTCKPIMSKPKPKPVVKEAPADNKAPAEGPAPTPTGNDAPMDGTCEGNGSPADAPNNADSMDVGLD